MGNRKKSKIGRILEVAQRLPVFTLNDLASMETNKKYLRILLARHAKSGNLLRLKKGMYVTKEYLDHTEKAGHLKAYAEFLAGILHEPSYLSLEYILHQHSVITESPVAMTAVTHKKTASFLTPFGMIRYHSISPKLFTGFSTTREGDYLLFRASQAKALFDFLYFRKTHLVNQEAIRALRLNLNDFRESDKKELARYMGTEGSRRMKTIYKMLWKK